MSRRPAIRQTDIDAAAAALEARGLKPYAMDFYPNGKVRFHFMPPPEDDNETSLDRELADFEARRNES